jgi:XTP/dITP diphosphohydrolase
MADQEPERSLNAPLATLVLATQNPGKVAELVDLLADVYEVVPRPEGLAETVEDGATLEANAAKKAREVAAHTGAAALADDTGLFVAALDGRPGVHTARYAGPEATSADNRALLLAELAGCQGRERAAEFRTVLVLHRSDGTTVTAEGRVVGTIAEQERGDGGFGYDALFVPDEGDGRCFAEMTRSDKAALSHRARALADLLAQLGVAQR